MAQRSIFSAVLLGASFSYCIEQALAQPLPAGVVATFGSSRLQHTEKVKRVAWLPDQKRIATRTENYVTLWQLGTGQVLWRVPIEGGTERLLEYAAPGWLIVQNSDGLCFLDEAGKTQFTLNEPSRKPWNIAVSGNGKKLLVVWRQGPTMLYELSAKGPQEPGWQIAKGVVYAPGFTEDGNTLIFTNTKEVEVWDLKKFTRQRSYEAKNHPVAYHSTRISPDGQTMAAIGGETLRFWKAGQTVEWDKFQSEEWLQPLGASEIGFIRDSQSFVIIMPTGRFGRWSTQTGKLLATVEMRFKAESLQLSPDGKKLAVLNGNGVSLWDTCLGESLGGGAGPSLLSTHFIAVDRLLSLGEDQSLFYWEAAKGRLLKVGKKPAIEDWQQAVLSADGRWWAEWTQENKVLIGDLETGKMVQRLTQLKAKDMPWGDDGLPIFLGRLAFRPDGAELVTTEVAGGWQFWDPQSGRLIRSFTAGVPSRLEYAPDRRSIAAYLREGGAVAVCDAKTGQQRFLSKTINNKADQVASFHFSPSGQYLAIAHAEVLCVVSTISGRILFRRPLEPEVRVPEQVLMQERALGQQTAIFSPDERWLIHGHVRSSKLYLYDIDAACLPGCKPQIVEAHTGGILSLNLSPDGKYLVTTGQEGVALVWDTKKLFKAAPKPAMLAEIKLSDDWWAGLRQADEQQLSHLMVAMVHDPDKSVKLLATQLKPVSEPDQKTLEKWLRQLTSEQFVLREGAARSLAELGELAEPALRAALKKPHSVDFELRAKAILHKLEEPEAQPDRLRRFRALELLERIGTPAAREILTRLSKGAIGARVTVEATEALRRLQRRASLGSAQ